MARSEESTITHEDNNNVAQEVTDISDSADSGPSELPGIDDIVWYYMHPLGNVHGPFSMTLLLSCTQRLGGSFGYNLKVWRAGQSRHDAVFLADIYHRYR